MIEIIEPGPFASIQDAGRSGFARVGVARCGAFDRAALRLANRLVGNRPDAAAIELTLGGLAFRVHDAVTVALSGGVCPGLDWGTATTLAAGTTVRLRAPSQGLRSYLALRGAVAVAPVLG
jgi:allophanate hydrolase subunit 2